MKRRLLAGALALVMLLALGLPAAGAEENTLHISTAEQLRQLAKDCALDSYSLGLTVILDGDIDLGEEPFYPIPSFSGVFDGGGHRIYHMTTATDGSHQGLFRYVQAEGTVKNLRVEGTVAPGNSRCQVGGIVGTCYGRLENCSFSGSVSGLNYVGGVAGESTGSVTGCSAQGSVDGKRFTGGVVGYSAGVIENCENEASVNTGISEGGLELESMNVSGLLSMDLTGAEDADVVSDSGGIVGFSKGSVTGCVNRGPVGYPHYGYNVGGVAGRQSGYLAECENRGEILGRKDVGGIVGQMEPYMLLKSSASLADELNTLHYLVDRAMGNLTNMSDEIHDVLADIRRAAAETKKDLEREPEPSPEPSPELPPEPSPEVPPETSPEVLPETSPEVPPEASPEIPPESSPELPPEAPPEPSGNTVPEPPAGDAPEPESAPESEGDRPPEPETGASLAAGPERSRTPGQAGGYVLLAAGPGDTGTETGGAGTGSGDSEPETPGGDIGDLLPELRPGTDLTGRLDRLAGNMGDLVGIMGESSGALGPDLVAVSDQLTKVLIMMADAMTGSPNRQILEDISERPWKAEAEGLVERCENLGSVEGDRNVGGIAGTMGIEYEFDLEGTLAETIGMGSILTSTYQTRCVLTQSVNRSDVEAKWDNVGAVTGLTELGVVSACQGYGSAGSTEGGYAGGIVGCSNTAVRDCWAMCRVYGLEYIGGVAGQGKEISGCVSLPELGEATACAGAIAGWADMSGKEVRDNVFVHESAGAVDGISYAGRAEPVSFEELAGRSGLPEEFKSLRLRFVAQGETVAELEFPYGGSIDPARIPPVPEREGYTGSWPDYDYSCLTFSDTVEAVYTSRQAALASGELRSGGPLSVVLLEGDFADGAEVALRDYNGPGPQLDEGQVLEQWVLELRDGDYAGEPYTVRYLPPETEKNSRVELYLYRDGDWSKAVTGKSGSYLTFDASGDRVVFCAAEQPAEGPDTVTLAAAAAGLVLLACAAGAASRRKKKKAAAAAAVAQESAER